MSQCMLRLGLDPLRTVSSTRSIQSQCRNAHTHILGVFARGHPMRIQNVYKELIMLHKLSTTLYSRMYSIVLR
jgi:hypothetical protein